MAQLSDKREIFIAEYLATWNATEAARRAGYAYPRQEGTRLLSNADIRERISEELASRCMTAEEALTRLAAQGRGSLGDFVDVDPGIKNGVFLNFPKAAATGKLDLVKKLKYNSEGYPEIELYDAQNALIQILKLHGRYKENVVLSGDEDNPLVIRNEVVDYRHAIAALAPGSVSDSDSPGED